MGSVYARPAKLRFYGDLFGRCDGCGRETTLELRYLDDHPHSLCELCEAKLVHDLIHEQEEE